MSAAEGRLERRFRALAAAGRAGLVTFLTAGDPDARTALEIVRGLPAAGADVIELGMPFSDPVADGPAIQAAGQRALAAGADMPATLELVRAFRGSDDDTPVVLMGYYNPIHAMGCEAFAAAAATAGVDGLIVVDLPPEEDAALRNPAAAVGLRLIRLTTPTTDQARLGRILEHAAGFVYYAAVTGTTGAASAQDADVEKALARLRRHTQLPLAVGFGIKTPEQVAAVARVADAAVVGSAIVECLAATLEAGRASGTTVAAVLGFVARLAAPLESLRAPGGAS
ncbi:MAG TPA: tryptophan synthase subunit alpha [Alphaproteobacteria bacterium]|jgi:tryptophan synthase alpha chain|nr:tryptophan synthase subunit alpha [Alphaproteobacteria bacterium]MDP6269039.1 tryptophan synthase subunit alpha [Alphaproteobacteria bacterium]MDP7426561.1 tryptophan synthase subunit alpha [Alphaproteobacteria bacterium]HJM52377.1 tryptophan synthase subunit alpha [Alphaproteobacteria bacterium]